MKRGKRITEPEGRLRTVIGENIRTRRRAAGLSQSQVGDYLGISHQQIQKYEDARNSISAEKLFLLATFLKCSVDYFYGTSLEIAAAECSTTDMRGLNAMQKNFSRILSPSVRKKLSALVKSLAQ